MDRRKKIVHWKEVEKKLKVADILFVRDNKSILSRAIRETIKSYWNHVALISFIPNKKLLFNNILIIEAVEHGMEIHRIQKYSSRPDQFDLGIKRVPNLSQELREKVLAYMLNNVDVPYDYLRLFVYLTNKLLGNFLDKYKDRLKDMVMNKDNFVCSTFVQKAFYETMPDSKKNLVIFKEKIEEPFGLEEVTPYDIAVSKNCQWIYNPHK